MASNGCITPSWPPSSSITLTSRARIRSLMRIRSACRKFLSAITPPHRHKNNKLDLFGNMPSANFRGRHDPPHHVHRKESTGDGLQSIARCLLLSASVTSAASVAQTSACARGGLCSFDFCRFCRTATRQNGCAFLVTPKGGPLRFLPGSAGTLPETYASRPISSRIIKTSLDIVVAKCHTNFVRKYACTTPQSPTLNCFRMNTCKSVSKQRTLSLSE